MPRSFAAVALALSLVVLAGCGVSSGSAGEHEDPPAPGEGADEFDEEAERVYARSLLGQVESELDEFVRVGRRGDEHFALTEDYRLGRDTVELDADEAGRYRVVSVTVELMDGPETFTEP